MGSREGDILGLGVGPEVGQREGCTLGLSLSRSLAGNLPFNFILLL